MSRLAGKIALITGGARGLGAAIAERFATEGAAVVVADIDGKTAQETTDRLGEKGLRASALEADVTDEESWARMFDHARDKFGPVNILVNNAGIGILASIEETSLEIWRKTLSVNLDGVFLGTKAAIEHMKETGGAIVNMSSIRAMAADPMSLAYDVSKGGVLSLTKSAAVHCAQQGYNIRINSLHPGYVMTDLLRGATEGMTNVNEVMSTITGLHPIGRMGKAEEIANAALFLASDEASFAVGSALVVDGGYTAV